MSGLSKFFKGCHPQNLVSPLLNALPQMSLLKFFCENIWQLISIIDVSKYVPVQCSEYFDYGKIYLNKLT